MNKNNKWIETYWLFRKFNVGLDNDDSIQKYSKHWTLKSITILINHIYFSNTVILMDFFFEN